MTRAVNRGAALTLEPGPDVEPLGGDRFVARTDTPRLRLVRPGGVPAGRWVTLRFRTAADDDPVRPVLHFEGIEGNGAHAILPGAVAGAGIWTGRIPPDCRGLLIDPVGRPGPFAFAADAFRVLGRAELLAGAVRRDPGLALGALAARLRGRRVRSRHLLAAVWATTPLADYDGWRRARATPPLRLGPPEAAPRIGLLLDADGPHGAALRDSLRSLADQAGGPPPLFVSATGPLRPDAAAALPPGSCNPRPPEAALAAAVAGVDWVGVLRAGDRLAPDTLAAFARILARDGTADLAYSDEEDHRSGRAPAPVFKPGWSPRLQEELGYVGGLALVRADRAGLAGDGPLETRLLRAVLARPDARALHLRRIALHRGSPASPGPLRPPPARSAAPLPSVSVVIPSKDRVDLLRLCLEGLRFGTDGPPLDIVVVDNGSEAAQTQDYYRGLSGDGRVRILERPGPFNYSALTNAGVAASRGAVLVLLNNDIEVVERDWLLRLTAELGAPDVAAVGPKLLYPSGRVQHTGVVIGLGGGAGHLYRNRADDGPGWMGRLSATHEVSAVTGACLVVPRAKFDAVGGLDEERFPISFNDIDLCLKFRERGWRNLVVPGSELVHHESASRGRDDAGVKQARAEREAGQFAERWLHVMRDDPYYHPAMSLLRYEPSLG